MTNPIIVVKIFMKASDLFVRCLEQEGVETVFAVPGEENLDLLDSLARSSIEVVLTRHEQGAGFMAATYGRLTGKPGVCMATLGPGATNLVTAAAFAQLGGMPMLMITGQKPIKSSKQGLFQLIDVVGMMTPVTKFTRQIASASAIPSRIRNAFRLAREERPGAVHLELPEDIAREETDVPPITESLHRRPVVDDQAVASAVELLRECKRPLLLVGAGANRNQVCRSLRHFVEHTGMPFVTTQMGKGVLDETHPLCLGTAAMSDGDFCHQAIEQADGIVNVGHDVIEKPPFFMDPNRRKVLHIHFNPATIDPVYFPQRGMVGDIATSVEKLTAELDPLPEWDFQDFHRLIEASKEDAKQRAPGDTFPVQPLDLVNTVRNFMPDDGILSLDNGVYKIWFARDYPARHPNTVLLDNALATMGAGLPSALAAWRTFPDRQVIAVCGDGGFMMNSQEMETAVRIGANVIILVLRDNAFGMIRWKQAHMGLADQGLTYGNPDFPAYAAAYGAHGHRIDQAGQLSGLLHTCAKNGGVHLIEIPVDYSDNANALFEDIPAAAQRAAELHSSTL